MEHGGEWNIYPEKQDAAWLRGYALRYSWGRYWRIATSREFVRLTTRSEAPIRAGRYHGDQEDAVPPRYAFDYNDVANMEFCSSIPGWKFFNNYEFLGGGFSQLFLSSVAMKFKDSREDGPFMTPDGSMMVVVHLRPRRHDDVRAAVDLACDVQGVEGLDARLFLVECRDGSFPPSEMPHWLKNRWTRPFKVVVSQRARVPMACKTMTSAPRTKSSLASLAREAALTTLDDLKAVFVDVRMRNEFNVVLPGSYAKGRARLPLVLPYVWDFERWRNFCNEDTPLLYATGNPWCLGSAGLNAVVVEKIATLVPDPRSSASAKLRRKWQGIGASVDDFMENYDFHEKQKPGHTPADDFMDRDLLSGCCNLYTFRLDKIGYMAFSPGPWTRSTRAVREMNSDDFWGDYFPQDRDADDESENHDWMHATRRAIVWMWQRETLPLTLLSIARDLRMERRWKVVSAALSIRAGRWKLSHKATDIRLRETLAFLACFTYPSEIPRMIIQFL